MSKHIKDDACLLLMLLNQSNTAAVFLQRLTLVSDTVFFTILSRSCLLTLPNSLFVGLISLHVGVVEKLGLWSFSVMKDSRSAIASILSSRSSLVCFMWSIQRISCPLLIVE